MTRREFVSGLAAASVAAPLLAKFDRPLGVQLYTVRSLMASEGEATLRAIAAIGYREVELSLAEAKKFAALLKEIQLKPAAAHIDGTVAALAPARLDELIGMAKELGVPAIGLPYVPPNERTDPAAFWPKFVDQLNAAGERCHKAGLTFYYHHHNFEFDPRAHAFDLLHRSLTKDVKLEIDCFWASVGGADPAELIAKWNGRLFALHLKDKANGTPVSYDTNFVKPAEFREVGAGMIDWPKVLKAGQQAGAKHFFVEQDYTPGDPLASLKQSYAFLRSLN